MPGHVLDTINLTYIEKDYPEANWTWAFDSDHPTNRRVAVPYDPETSLTTVIDYYLLSPNLSVEEIRTIDLDFRSSDHQPVLLKARLIPE
jgi:endonuclease/exonuclease/phosphatase family metal-dependent hydrolase